MRSGMTVWSTAVNDSTPSMVIVDEPAPSTSRAHAVEERGEVGDLRLAGRVVDDGRALREDCRHQRVLGRAHARVLEQDARAGQQVGARLDVAVCELERRAELLEPLQVHVDRTRTEVVAARHRDTRPTQPARAAGRARRSTPACARPVRTAPRARCPTAGRSSARAARFASPSSPSTRSRSLMQSTSAMAGTLRST